MLSEIPRALRPNIHLEEGYGEAFGVSDDNLKADGFRIATRELIFSRSDVVLLPKPVLEDVAMLREGGTLWGWPHCVQDSELTQIAIDRKLTLIAFEAMYEWPGNNRRGEHTFRSNNQIAGFSSVTHAFQQSGETGAYGRPKSATVIGFGATGEGALRALLSQGVSQVYVLSRRYQEDLADLSGGAKFRRLEVRPGENGVVWDGATHQPLGRFLATQDIIVNCALQDPNEPLMFLQDSDLAQLKWGTLIVDISCDDAMGFSWARTTTFDSPTFSPWPGITHYAVDHSPSLYWKSATWELSEAILPFLGTIAAGRRGWEANPTLSRAIEISEGVVRNPDILAFQHREARPPHRVSPSLGKQ